MNWECFAECIDWILRITGLLTLVWLPLRIRRIVLAGEAERPQIDLIVKEGNYCQEGIDETVFPEYYPKWPQEAKEDEVQFFIRPEKGYIMRKVKIYRHILWQADDCESKDEDRLVKTIKKVSFDHPLCIICHSRDCEPEYFVKWSDDKGGKGCVWCREAYINEEFGGQSAHVEYGVRSAFIRFLFF